MNTFLTGFRRIGVVPANQVAEFVREMGWVQVDDNGLSSLTANGLRLLEQRNDRLRLRQAIIDYLDIVEPPWLQNARFGRQKVLLFAGSEVHQTFLEADLVDSFDDSVVGFWDSLAARARTRGDESKLAIGRRGERLSLQYEDRRTGSAPRWVALDNAGDGYDILSVVARDRSELLTIEVKTTVRGEGADFHITRNEWEIAEQSANHLFHLWDVSGDTPKLATLTPHQLRPHVATDQGLGKWTNLAVPVDLFGSIFTNVAAVT